MGPAGECHKKREWLDQLQTLSRKSNPSLKPVCAGLGGCTAVVHTWVGLSVLGSATVLITLLHACQRLLMPSPTPNREYVCSNNPATFPSSTAVATAVYAGDRPSTRCLDCVRLVQTSWISR